MIRTFLIADLRGYTSHSDAQGDRAAADVAERFVAVARESAVARSGTIVEVRGDEVFAVFDPAREALRAALDLQAGMADDAEENRMLGLGSVSTPERPCPSGRGSSGPWPGRGPGWTSRRSRTTTPGSSPTRTRLLTGRPLPD